tara:strand:- start:3084 stop:3218 length:135 start_codon:yes stop_codon:yes gene_type:complete
MFFNIGKKKRVQWFKVPMNCKTREDKDVLILDIINHLEQTIKIN